MLAKRRWPFALCATRCLLVCAVLASDARSAEVTRLAGSVPADARLFLAFRGRQSLLDVPVSLAMGRLMSALTPATGPAPTTAVGDDATARLPTSQPALFGWDPQAWRKLFAESVGLDNAKATGLLFTGSLALAADGWSGLGDAILLAEPTDPAALETELADRRDPTSADAVVRRYRLGRDHELACDGQTVVIGRSAGPSGIYARSVAVLAGEQDTALADVPAFCERLSGLPATAQLVFYAGTTGPGPSRGAVMGRWWPATWPQLQSVAAAVVVRATGVTLEANGRLDEAADARGGGGPPIGANLGLPASAVATWTHAIDYVQAFRELDPAYVQGLLPFVRSAMSSETLEADLLGHLVGDTIVTIGQFRHRTPLMDETERELSLPALALAVETDDPHTVQATMERLTEDFAASVSPQRFPEGQIPIERIALGPAGGRIVSIPVGEILWSESGCPFLRSLQFSWVVADRWLIVGTHADTVRQIVQVRRGESPALLSNAVPDALRDPQRTPSAHEMLLLARPRIASEMIDSWVGYVERHHPEMLQPQWWQSTGVQPVQSLRQAATLLRVFSSATYATWQPSPELIHARLELRFAPFRPTSRTRPD